MNLSFKCNNEENILKKINFRLTVVIVCSFKINFQQLLHIFVTIYGFLMNYSWTCPAVVHLLQLMKMILNLFVSD